MKATQGRAAATMLAAGLLGFASSAAAQAELELPTSDCKDRGFTVLRKDGGRVTGRLLGYEQGVAVVLRLPTGQLLEYRWSEIQPESLRVAPGCEASPPPSAVNAVNAVNAPASSSSWPARPLMPPVSAEEAMTPQSNSIHVRFTASGPGVILQRLLRSEQRYVPTEVPERFRLTQFDDWKDLCTAPCSTHAPPTATLRIIGPNIEDPMRVVLLAKAPLQQLRVAVGTPKRFKLAVSLVSVGSTLALLGILFLSFGGGAAEDANYHRGLAGSLGGTVDPSYDAKANRFFIAGGVLLGSGVVSALVGLPLLFGNGHQVTQSPVMEW